jgi:hypothetical protein
MSIGKFIKSPAERKRYTIDYSNWLDTTETVASVTYAVTPVEAGGLVVDSSSVTPTTGIFYISLGNLSSAYTITATMTSSANQIKQDTIAVIIRIP